MYLVQVLWKSFRHCQTASNRTGSFPPSRFFTAIGFGIDVNSSQFPVSSSSILLT